MNGTGIRGRIVFAFVAALLFAIPAGRADDIILTKGKLRGTVVKKENGVTYVNVYNSTNPKMTLGLEAVPSTKIKQVVESKAPDVVYLRALRKARAANKAMSADAEVALAELAAKQGLDDIARAHFIAALRHDVNDARARKALGRDVDRIIKSDPALNPALRKALDEWYASDDAAERKSQLRVITRDFGYARDPVYLERVRRSRKQPKGLIEDRPLTLNARDHAGVYTLFVPTAYDPERPWPLVLALHGGGPDGKDGRDVFGFGAEAMNFYRSCAQEYGYIVVAPSALRAPWGARVNEPFVMSVLEEIGALYNIDLNRVYLTGHSMGGIGTWFYGQKFPHRWAAIAPTAGAGANRTAQLQKTRTPVFIYHSEDDPVVGCGDSRAAAERFKKSGHDFVYTELSDREHSLPAEVVREIWTFFEARRLAATKRRNARGKFHVQLGAHASFGEPVSKGERLYFGAPGETLATDKKALLKRILLRGGAAVAAADGLVALKDKSTVGALAKLVKSKKRPDDVRAAAAHALGKLGYADGASAVHASFKGASLELMAPLATATGALGGDAAVAVLAKALRRVSKEFDARLTGSSIALSDRKRVDRALAAIADALRVLGDRAGADALRAVGKKVLARRLEPIPYGPAQRYAEASLGRAVVAYLEALAVTGARGDVALVDTLVGMHGRLSGVERAATAAKTKLSAVAAPSKD